MFSADRLSDVRSGRCHESQPQCALGNSVALHQSPQQLLSASALRPLGEARRATGDINQAPQTHRVSSGHDETLLTLGKGNQHSVVERRFGRDDGDVGICLGCIERMEVDGRRKHFSVEETAISNLTALGEHR